MRPMRQIEAAELMNTAGNYTSSYAKALLAATRQADLVKADKPKQRRLASQSSRWLGWNARWRRCSRT